MYFAQLGVGRVDTSLCRLSQHHDLSTRFILLHAAMRLNNFVEDMLVTIDPQDYKIILIASPGFFASQSMNQRFGRYQVSSSGNTRSSGLIPSEMLRRLVRKESTGFLSGS